MRKGGDCKSGKEASGKNANRVKRDEEALGAKKWESKGH